MADTDFHIVEQIKLARSKREIATILLQVPDTILMSHGEIMKAECRRYRFREACTFIDLRLAVLDARRDKSGMLPDLARQPLESWRLAFAAFAQSSPR